MREVVGYSADAGDVSPGPGRQGWKYSGSHVQDCHMNPRWDDGWWTRVDAFRGGSDLSSVTRIFSVMRFVP